MSDAVPPMYCCLRRIQSSHQRLPEQVDGLCYRGPQVGQRFIMFSEDIGDTTTSTVLELTWDPPNGSQLGIGCVFKTKNSTYHLDLIF